MTLKKAAPGSENGAKMPGPSAPWRVLSIGAVGLLFSLSIHLSHLPFWHDHKEFYYDGDKPLMTTLDAYYYLRLASAEIAENKGDGKVGGTAALRGPTKTPLLASLAAFLQCLCNIAIERIAFFLPPLLGSLMALIYVCWGHSMGGPAMALTASVAGLSSFYWFRRTGLGRFDTDCLNPVFVFLVLFLTYRFAVSTGRIRWLYVLAAFVSAYLLGIWWQQLPYFGFFLILGPYCLSLYLPSSRLEKILKISGLLAFTTILIIILAGYHEYLPEYFSRAAAGYLQQYDLVRKAAPSAAVFPDVGQSISELQPLPLAGIATEVGGHPITFLLALAGFCLLLKAKKDAACFLLTGAALASLSLLSRRFLIFLVPLHALGFGYLFARLWSWIHQQHRFENPAIKAALWGVSALVCLGLLLPNLHRSIATHRGPPLTAGDVLLARTIAAEAGANAVIWSWWDYGYFLEYLTGLRAFIDGGSQSPERTFIAAFPLACDDPVLAGNWLRFFAVHDVAGWNQLAASLGSADRALGFFKEVFANPAKAPDISKAYGLDEAFMGRAYLFPETRVFLYLNDGLLQKTHWWYFFGTWDPGRGTGNHPRFWMVPSANLELLKQTGSVEVGGRRIRVGKVIEVKWDGAATTDLETASSSHEEGIRPGGEGRETTGVGGYIALKMLSGESLLVFQPSVLQSLTFCLSVMSPFSTAGFTPLAFKAGSGGVWSVE